jgi:hypothetical protein
MLFEDENEEIDFCKRYKQQLIRTSKRQNPSTTM